MNPFEMIMAVGFPLVMAIGGIAAWRMSQKEDQREAEKPQWRDTSLDDWRKQRDAEVEVDRVKRAQTTTAQIQAGSAEEKQETQRTQRIGG
ncbi:MAG: hypothetical protein ACRDG3_05680 [Tepidiformaceae bacterium]